MDRTVQFIALVSCIIGAMGMSYVGSSLVAKKSVALPADGLRLRHYWRLLSLLERCMFWTGLLLLATPFVIALVV